MIDYASAPKTRSGVNGILGTRTPIAFATAFEIAAPGEITGGSPYGASTLAGDDGSRRPSENELAIARFQGRHVAEIAGKLSIATAEQVAA